MNDQEAQKKATMLYGQNAYAKKLKNGLFDIGLRNYGGLDWLSLSLGWGWTWEEAFELADIRCVWHKEMK